ncbi:flagellar M-ring protein FliF [Bacillus sp. LL01]|uniref:flagellar basal-body MS-ring/collar protein FliF n=1 Tax=Bacillus sp. LL01 TaxID=1665556 RepID=UPI00064D4047|nr:flagellar basal-body MS-ring/collar protein FliF [Bacillus sp. LL01]KMJ58636.1 flagellar M-ring protein FliF [Bacillus sp. LL01]
MKERLLEIKNKTTSFWSNRTNAQKTGMVSTVIVSFFAVAAIVYFLTKTDMAPLYKDLTVQETGQIKEVLDGRGIQSQITDNGTAILVPQQAVDSLKVELAAEGLPKSGSIDYSFFGERSGFGMTDNEFRIMKLDAMQTELANLVKSIEGVKGAQVMLSLPEEGVFVREATQEASASIVIDNEPGYQFDQNHVNALYHLVSKSIPNLSTDNIVIMNQNFEYFDLKNNQNTGNSFDVSTQLQLKKEIERDIQRQVQQMLGMMMGYNKVVVSVTTDIDFTQEAREENTVTPVDPENMEGIAVSVERITETYTGSEDAAGGVPGAGEADIPAYVAGGGAGSGDYERMEERINNEVNRIRSEIVESPYKVRDLGIQVMVEPPVADDPLSIQANTVEDIRQILSTIVRTTIDKNMLGEDPQQANIDEKIVVSVQQFNGKVDMEEMKESIIPTWVYVAAGILLAVILLLLFLLLRRGKKDEEEEEEVLVEEETVQINVPDINNGKDSESTARRKQLEKMAKEKPDEFAKLLRSWLSE